MGEEDEVVNDKIALTDETVSYSGDGVYDGFTGYRFPQSKNFIPNNEYEKILGFYRGVDRILAKNDKILVVGMSGEEIGFHKDNKLGINMEKLWRTQRRNDKNDYREFMIQVKGVNYHQLAHFMFGNNNYKGVKPESNEYYCLEALNDCRDETLFAETFPRSKEYLNFVYFKQYLKGIDDMESNPMFATQDPEVVKDCAFIQLYGRKSYVSHRIIKKYEKRFEKRYGELKTKVVKNIVDKFMCCDSVIKQKAFARKLASILDMKKNNPMHDFPTGGDGDSDEQSQEKDDENFVDNNMQMLQQVVNDSKEQYDNDEQEKQEQEQEDQNSGGNGGEQGEDDKPQPNGGGGKSDGEQEKSDEKGDGGGGSSDGSGDNDSDGSSPNSRGNSKPDESPNQQEDNEQKDEKDNPSGSGAPIKDDENSEDEEEKDEEDEKQDEQEDYEDAEDENDDEQPDDEQNEENELTDMNAEILETLLNEMEHLKEEVDGDVSQDIKSIRSNANPFAPPTQVLNNSAFRADEEAQQMKRKTSNVLKMLTDELSLSIHRKQRTGRLDLRSAMRPKAISGEDCRIFRRKVSDKKDYAKIAMVICLDTSSSMDELNKLHKAKKAAWIISEAMEECDNPVSLIIFRSHATDVKVVKDFNKKGHWNFNAGGGTEPSTAIKLGVRMLDNLQKKDEIDNLMLIVVTDGEWCQWDAYRHLFDKIHREYEDIETIQIDVAHAGEDRGAKHYIKLKEFEELPVTLKEIVIDMQKNINRRLL